MNQPQEPLEELARTRIFPDPTKPSRYIRGILLGNPVRATHMQVWFYHDTSDSEPYWATTYALSNDRACVAYHRRPLYRGLLNIWAKRSN